MSIAKRILTLLALMLSLPIMASEENDRKVIVVDEYKYIIDYKNLTATVTGPNRLDDDYLFQLQTCEIPESIEYDDKVFSVTAIGNRAFSGWRYCKGRLSIPNTVKTIGDSAFYGCEELTGRLVIPDSVETIGNYAFYRCLNITGRIVIPNTVKTIGDYAFCCCWNLSDDDYNYPGPRRDLIIGDSVTKIGQRAFEECINLKGELILPESLTYIGDWAFGTCSGFTGDLVIPEGIKSIGEFVFAHWKSNGNLVIPESVTSIGKNAFFSSEFTGKLNIPESVRSIGSYAFADCKGFTELSLPSSLKVISVGTFLGCEQLSGDLTIPDCVTTIEEVAFADCCNFNGILTLPRWVTYIGYGAFDSEYDQFTNYCKFSQVRCLSPVPPNNIVGFRKSYCNRTPLFVPEGSESEYATAPVWKDFKTIDRIETSGVEYLKNENNVQVRVESGNIIAPKGSEVFDLNGRRVKTAGLSSGIYIVRTPDGKTLKIRL